LALLQLQLQLQQPPQVLQGLPESPASVDGVVIDSVTKQPLAGATVLLQDRLHSEGRMITVTGNEGRFAFRSVTPGMYVIEASRSGYASEMAGELLNVPNLPPEPLAPNVNIVQQLAAGQTLSGIRLVLTPGGAISGRLTDERGEVVAGAVVQALKTTYKNGLRERILVQSVVSNDLGDYRFFMLKPGQYSIALVPSTLSIQNISMQAFSIPLFYPGTIDAKEAKVFDLRVGETIDSVNFLSVPVKNRRISGGVQGNGTVGVTVVLSPANGTAIVKVAIAGDTPSPTFQFSDIVPGSYMLVAHNVYGRAAIPLDVRNADVLGTRVLLGEGFRIPSRVRVEGHPPGDDPELEKIYFSARPDVPVPGLEPEVYSPFADGRFILEVFNRDYWIDITRTEGYYIKSITLDGFDVLNKGLHAVSSVEGPLEIVVDNHFGEVQGSAAAPNVTVVLVPDAVRRNQRPLYKSMRASNGAFRFEKIPPGDYKLFAWSEDTIDNGGPWLDPDYLRQYEDRGTPVRVQGDMRTILARPIPVF
jgi:carboxypeptidase family protein